LTKMTKKIN